MIDTIYLECNLATLTTINESTEDYLIVTKTPDSFGQGFRGIDVDGEVLPLGGTFLEFPRLTSASRDADVRDYKTNDLNGIANYSAVLYDYLCAHSELEKLSSYKCLLNGRSYQDFVLGDSLSILEAFDAFAIKRQLARLASSDPLHPRNKGALNPLASLPYEGYCRKIYGDYLYDALFKPIKEKIIGAKSVECLKYHRANWLPLYWPESILKKLENNQDLECYQFYKFSRFNFAQWTRKLCEAVDCSRVVLGSPQLIKRNRNNFTVFLDNGRRLQCRRVVSSLNAQQLNGILRFTDRTYDAGNSIYLAYLRSDVLDADKLPEAQFVLDPSNVIYRISTYASHVCIEISSTALNAVPPEDRAARVALDFNRVTGAEVNALSLCYLREFGNARVNLSKNNYEFHQELLRANEKLAIDLTGSAIGFGVGSIADQLIQGLRLASYSRLESRLAGNDKGVLT